MNEKINNERAEFLNLIRRFSIDARGETGMDGRRFRNLALQAVKILFLGTHQKSFQSVPIRYFNRVQNGTLIVKSLSPSAHHCYQHVCTMKSAISVRYSEAEER